MHNTQEHETRNRENTRARLIQAAASVFLEKGFNGAKIDDIVKAAGFTRGAFYSNFTSLEELLHQVIIHQAHATIDDFRRGIEAMNEKRDVEALVNLLHTLRPQGHNLYILVAEVMLYKLRNPTSKYDPGTSYGMFKEEIVTLIEEVYASMGRTPRVPTESVADLIVSGYLSAIARTQTQVSTTVSPADDIEILTPFVTGILNAFSKPIHADKCE